jgi:hypothetical protein
MLIAVNGDEGNEFIRVNCVRDLAGVCESSGIAATKCNFRYLTNSTEEYRNV